MKLIVGLGNPGKQYEKTRHNLGFMVVEQFLKNFEPVGKTVWEDSKKFKADIVEIEWKRRSSHGSSGLQPEASAERQTSLEKVLLVKPKTYMNNSGLAVSLLATYYKIPATGLWVIHDELDLPLGALKIRFGGGSAGHKGIESIIQKLGIEKFWRFRLGIGTSHRHTSIGKHMIDKADEFVLDNFSPMESNRAKALAKRGANAIAVALEKGIERAMNQFNTK